MLAFIRFRVPAGDENEWSALARSASDFFSTRAGCLRAEVVRNLDDPTLWALVSRWEDVGSYRRAYNGYDAKLILTPLMLQAIDEPTSFASPDAVGPNLPRGE